MGIGVSPVLIAVSAVLAFAVHGPPTFPSKAFRRRQLGRSAMVRTLPRVRRGL